MVVIHLPAPVLIAKENGWRRRNGESTNLLTHASQVTGKLTVGFSPRDFWAVSQATWRPRRIRRGRVRSNEYSNGSA